MAYREPPAPASIVSFSGDNAIKKVEGLYRGYTTQDGKYGKTYIQSFDNNGEIVSVYSKGQLNYKLKSIPVGTWVRVTCLGTEYVEKLSADCYQFSVEIDDERSEVKGSPPEEVDEDIDY
jgi:hypothetical protein